MLSFFIFIKHIKTYSVLTLKVGWVEQKKLCKRITFNNDTNKYVTQYCNTTTQILYSLFVTLFFQRL